MDILEVKFLSDVILKEMPLREALKSRLLRTVRESPGLMEEGQGGCTLWEKRDVLEEILNN